MNPAILLLAATIIASCSRATPTTSETVILDAEQPSAILTLPPRHGGRLLIEIAPIGKGAKGPVTVAVSAVGNEATVERFSLYPPDRPGRFALRNAGQGAAVKVSIEGEWVAAGRLSIRAIEIPK